MSELWYMDQTDSEIPGYIDGVLHPFANAWFYEIHVSGEGKDDIMVMKGTILNYDIYTDRLYDVYIWLKQGLVSNAWVEWEG